MKKSRLFFAVITLVSDFLMIGLSFVLAYLIRSELNSRPLADPTTLLSYLGLVLIISSLGILVFFINGLYNVRIPSERPYEIKKLFMAISTGAMIVIAADFTQNEHIFPSKSIPIYGWLISLFLVFLGRQIIKTIQKYLFKYKIGVQNTLIIGANNVSQKIINEAKKRPYLGYNFIGILDSKINEDSFEGIKILGTEDDLAKVLERHHFDEIIQANPMSPQKTIEAVKLSDQKRIEFKLAPSFYDVYTFKNSVSILAGIPIVELIRTPLEGWGRIAKRAFDLVGSSIGLIIFSPIFLLIAILIKLTDKGPIFYKHERIGRADKTFGVYKFRSMKLEYCIGENYGGEKAKEAFEKIMKDPEKKEEFQEDFKLKDDPRVTKIGKFLRKTSLDELPQFINVFKGEMSLVGPRPIVKDEAEKYGESKYQRTIVKPGMTGLWQISGRNDLNYKERSKLDIYYIENWSLLLDIKILIKTFSVFFKKNGAY